MEITGKVIVVTGAGSGIGRQVALEARRRGARVAAVDRDGAALEETVGLAADPGRISTHVVDITDRTAVEDLPVEVEQRLATADGLIHCAGIIQPFVRVQDLDDAAIEKVMAVNWWGTVHLVRAFLPIFLTRPQAHIVNVSSMGGFLPVPGQTIYGASKAAVKLFTEGLHAELRDTDVRVTIVFPGAVATNITANSGVAVPVADPEAAEQAHRTTPADEAARIILDGMQKDAYRVLVGRDAKMMDLLYRAAPRRAAELIAKKMKDLLAPVRT